MRKRASANTWVLSILLGIIVLVAVDIGRSYFTRAATEAPSGEAAFTPPFKVGEIAPDFTLPDRHGKKRSLSELVKGDTLLAFSCGCSNCKDVQTYLGKHLLPKLGAAAPKVVSVSTYVPDAEPSWVRDTRLQQVILYEEQGNSPVMDQYRGHPCPRMMRLEAGRKVTWIGTSPGENPRIEELGTELAEQLGFDAAVQGRHANGKVAPPMKREWGAGEAPVHPAAAGQPGGPTLPGGHHPGDGHGH